MYDNEDSVCGIIYNGVPYYFKKNLQGDIIAIVDKDAKEVARYSYDAWGACTVVSSSNVIGYANPFRYRGYYYDIENKLYYLNSRYYDPAVGRFINADMVEYIFQDNAVTSRDLYSYCNNEPIFKVDSFGNDSGYITNQYDYYWKNIPVGFGGNVRDNGCGAIAIYNILHSYSNKITFYKVLSDLKWKYGSIIYNNIGLFGISPMSVTNYLENKFILVYTAGPITYLWGIKSELSGGVIVLYQHKGWNTPLHYVAGIKDGSGYGGSFRFYNDMYYTKKYGKKPISIWKYIDLLKENGCKPLLFWGVACKIGWW